MSGASLDLLQDSFAGRSLIEASAGTGKTWTLTALYARLLLERQLSVSQILVVTFTTAATAELRERIRLRLAELLAVYERGHLSAGEIFRFGVFMTAVAFITTLTTTLLWWRIAGLAWRM